jgi:hypothetical protein
VVDRGGLENRCTLAGTVGSNPTLSAICVFHGQSLAVMSEQETPAAQRFLPHLLVC